MWIHTNKQLYQLEEMRAAYTEKLDISVVSNYMQKSVFKIQHEDNF